MKNPRFLISKSKIPTLCNEMEEKINEASLLVLFIFSSFAYSYVALVGKGVGVRSAFCFQKIDALFWMTLTRWKNR